MPASRNPAVILYDAAGVPLAVADGVAVPLGTKGIIATGVDAGGDARALLADSSRRVVVAGAGTAGSPAGGVATVQGAPGAVAVPVSGPLTDVQLRAAAVPVSLASAPLPTNAATEATLALIKTKTDNLDVLLSSRAVTGLTDAQLRATPVPVSGPLTDAQLRATPVPVSGTVATGGLTNAELRATPVPVSGTVTATGPLTDAQLRASAVPVDVSDRVGRLLGVLSAGANIIGKVGLDAANLAGVALDATVAAVRDRLPAALVGGRLSVDVGASVLPPGAATETTLATATGHLSSLDADVDVALSTRASQATLAAAAASLASLDTDFDVALSTRNAEVTQLLIKAKTDNLDALLSTRASEVTLAAIKDTDGIKKITDPLPAGTNTLGKVDQGAAGASPWPSSNAAGTQVDGHSVTIGTTTDADTALTVIGRLKKIVALLAGGLPAALVGGRLDTNIGAWLGATTPTVGQKALAASLPVALATEQTGTDNSTNGTSKVPTLGGRANAAAPAWTEGNQVPQSVDLLGNQRTKLSGIASAAGVNASTTPLGIAGVFTGTGEEVASFAFLTVQVFADQVSATDGLSFQWSGDNANWDTANGTSVLASAGRAFALTPRGRYFRVVYTNGGVAQTIFRLSTTFHPAGTGLISLPLDQSLTEENLAQTVRAILAGKDASGNFQNLTANPNKSLAVGIVGSRVIVGIYGASTARIAGTVGAQNLASIENPAASGKIVYVRKVKVTASLASTASTNYQYRLGRTTATPSAGTTLTVQKRDTADATAVGIARSGPTATAAAGSLWAGAGLIGSNNPNWGLIEAIAWDSYGNDIDDIVLAAGEGLIVSAEGNDTDLNHTVSFHWQEV